MQSVSLLKSEVMGDPTTDNPTVPVNDLKVGIEIIMPIVGGRWTVVEPPDDRMWAVRIVVRQRLPSTGLEPTPEETPQGFFVKQFYPVEVCQPTK